MCLSAGQDAAGQGKTALGVLKWCDQEETDVRVLQWSVCLAAAGQEEAGVRVLKCVSAG